MINMVQLLFSEILTLVCRLTWLKLLNIKAILSWTFSGGMTILSSCSVATNKVSIFVVFAIEG